MFYAAEKGSVDIVKLLLATNIDIDKPQSSGATPLYAAAFNGHYSVVELLIQANANAQVAIVFAKKMAEHNKNADIIIRKAKRKGKYPIDNLAINLCRSVETNSVGVARFLERLLRNVSFCTVAQRNCANDCV
jgi:ankyrin repeat protein